MNVGAMWLWRVRRGPLFHVGYRVGDFIPFADPKRFRPLIVEMAERAAREVLSVREKFK